MEYFEKVKEFIEGEFEAADRPDHLTHLERTVHWVKEMENDPAETLLIAAYAHDTDHAERWQSQEEDPNPEVEETDFTDEERLERHQKRGAEIVGDFLEQEGAPQELVSRVRELISKHEFGGDHEQNILKDADSLSFFENNTEGFLDATGKKFRKQDVQEKFDWMFNRISSEEAQNTAREWYEDAVERLEDR